VQLFLENAKAAGLIDYELPPIINVPLCPANPEHIVAVLVDYILLKRVPELTSQNMPKLMFGQTIHDNCPRRGHFENGEFVYKFGSEEEEKNYCLYAVGCKGPMTKSNCPIVRWNDAISWCVESGAPCIGCAMADPGRVGNNWVENNAPFLRHLRNVGFGGLTFNPLHIGLGVAGVVAAALVIHGFGMKATGRLKGGAPYEAERKWDKNHPDHALGSAEAARKAAEKNGSNKEGGDN
jgi:hydrogenase small subunit